MDDKCEVCGGTEKLSATVSVTKYFGFIIKRIICATCIDIYEKVKQIKER